jgi:hypothetical protein
MKAFNAEQRRNTEINNLLQKIKYKAITSKTKAPIFVEFYVNGRLKYKIIILLNDLKKMGAIKFDERNWDEINKTLEKNRKRIKATIIEGYWVEPIEPKFSQLCKDYEKSVEEKPQDNQISQNRQIKPENQLKSIDLITASIEPKDVIFLVLDNLFDRPTRFRVVNDKGEITYIKKLYNIAYVVNAPGKKVEYDKSLASNINNGLFKRKNISEYMKTNELKKPTLVQRSEDKKYLVLKNDIPIKRMKIGDVPSQHQSLYIDKTR